MRKAVSSWFALVLLTLSLVAGLSAQNYQGAISGAVTDPTGAVVPGAKVAITNLDKGTSIEATTTKAGEYSVPNLEPGLYSVKVSAPGFGTKEIKGIRLEVARSIREDVKLAVSQDQTINIVDQAPIVDTNDAVLQSTFTNQEINAMPLQGRDFINLVTLNPGIQRTPGGGFLSVTSNGNRYEDNNYIIDGIDDNDAYYGDTVINAAGVQGTPASHLPIDAIQEFNVQSSPEADDGFKPGSIIQVGIKSGSNAFHGTALYFHRNAAFDARNYFNPKPNPPSSLLLHQFGGSLGGPIVKDKLFFFVDYEGVRDRVGNPLNLPTPLTTTAPGGPDPSVSIPDAIATCTAAGTCSDLSLQMAKFFPANTTGNTSFPFDYNNTNREHNGIAKVDYHLNERHTFSFRYFHGSSVQNEEDANVLQPYFLSNANTDAQVFGASWTFVPTTHVVNNLRFGFNRFYQKIVTDDSSQST
ncbi:MAG: carboxypeptidase regulatory-like domain-containing protein, partial [Acidobacteriales bacterium]|nr:carboxypeptidase regulatory-like domain-containing protein [Terriglobales bacterium]